MYNTSLVPHCGGSAWTLAHHFGGPCSRHNRFLLCFVLFCVALFCVVLCCFVLCCFVLLCVALCCFVLLCSSQLGQNILDAFLQPSFNHMMMLTVALTPILVGPSFRPPLLTSIAARHPSFFSARPNRESTLATNLASCFSPDQRTSSYSRRLVPVVDCSRWTIQHVSWAFVC
jgi:hypothetical protein